METYRVLKKHFVVEIRSHLYLWAVDTVVVAAAAVLELAVAFELLLRPSSSQDVVP